MTNLKRLALSFTLMSVLAVGAFAGETNSPPCVPGETQGPPCASQSINDDSEALGQTETPPASETVELTDIAEAVFWALTLF